MSDLLGRIQALVRAGDFRVSEHGYDELASDSIPIRDAVLGLSQATVVGDRHWIPTRLTAVGRDVHKEA